MRYYNFTTKIFRTFFALLVLLQASVLSGQNPRIPVAGDIFYSGFDAQSYYSAFFEKDQAEDLWNFSFLKSPYVSKLTYAPCPAIVNGQRLNCDLVLSTQDGQKFYYKSQGENIYLKYALINSDMTKSGLMWVEVNGTMPEIFPQSGTYSLEFLATIDRKELSAKYNWLYAKGEKYSFSIVYRYSHSKNERGNVEINNTREKSLATTFNVSVNAEFFIWSKGKKEAYPLNPFLWTTYFKDDIIQKSFSETRMYTEAYVNDVLRYKTSGRQIVNIKIQSKRDTRLIDDGERSVVIYPNPTFGEVFFDLVNYPKANYKLDVYNVVGARVYTFDFPPSANSSLRADLSSLNRGIYQVAVFDALGKRLTSQRVNILNP